MVEASLLSDLGLVIIAATAISIVMRMLKQPLILGYVLGGIVIGRMMFGLIKNPSEIAILSELGVAFLLFIIGLELDIKKIKQVGPISLVIGVLQVCFTFLLGFGASILLGMPPIVGFYLGFGIAFSSTMVVIKLLADNKELESLHGQLVLGVMLVQDIFAVFVLSLLPFLNNLSPGIFAGFAIKLVLFVIILVAASWLLLPKLMKIVSLSSELLFMTALTVVFAFGYLAHALDFSIAIGAFFAGIALSSSPLHLDIGSKIE